MVTLRCRPRRRGLACRLAGPARPDALLREPGCDLVVLSCRPKPEWNELVSLEVEGRFYRLLRSEERQDGSWWAC